TRECGVLEEITQLRLIPKQRLDFCLELVVPCALLCQEGSSLPGFQFESGVNFNFEKAWQAGGVEASPTPRFGERSAISTPGHSSGGPAAEARFITHRC